MQNAALESSIIQGENIISKPPARFLRSYRGPVNLKVPTLRKLGSTWHTNYEVLRKQAEAKIGRKKRAIKKKLRGVVRNGDCTVSALDPKPARLDPVIYVPDTKAVSLKGDGEEVGDLVKPRRAMAVAALRTGPPGAKPLTKTTEIEFGMKKKGAQKNRARARLPGAGGPNDPVVKISTVEIMEELQAKYPGLRNLYKSTGNQLSDALKKKIAARVEALGKNSRDFMESCFKMTRGYRRAHPHFGDFQFVLSTLHSIQDATGVPRSQLQEADLAAAPVTPLVPDMSNEKITQLCDKYTRNIVKRMSEHIMGLQSDISPTDSEDDIARKQVREELKKLNPFLPVVVGSLVQKHFMPKDGPFFQVRIYGEPFLPNKQTMRPFMMRYKAVNVKRSARMYNMIKINVPPAIFHSLMAMNGTVLNGAKLMICSSDVAKYNKRHAPVGGEETSDVDMDDEAMEDWNEMEEEE